MSGCSRSHVATGRHLVVVASADPPETDALADRLRDAVTVRTAYDTEEVLARLDPGVDVVLVDPALADGAVEAVRGAVAGRGLNAVVAVLSDAPDAAGADAVVSPSVPDATLRAIVLRLATEARYRKTLEAYYDAARTSARAADDDVDRERLEARLDRLSRRLDDAAEPLDPAALFRAVLDPDEEHE